MESITVGVMRLGQFQKAQIIWALEPKIVILIRIIVIARKVIWNTCPIHVINSELYGFVTEPRADIPEMASKILTENAA